MKIYYLILFILFCFFCKAQNSLHANIGIKKSEGYIIPTTPESYSLFKATDYPIDYKTGKLNTQIPIYNIKVDDINIPIQLSYNTGGIKVDEISSTIGLGWSLSIPNIISVEQHGREDLGSNYGGSWYPKHPENYNYQSYSTIGEPDKSKFYNLWEQNNNYDTQPDIFHYNLPSISGSFIRTSDGKFHTIPNENVIINYSDDSFTIIDPKGIKYTLLKKNIIDRRNISNLLAEVSTTTYFLTSINLPSGKIISFEYNKILKHKKETHNNTLRFSTNSLFFNFQNNINSSKNYCSDKFKNTNSTTTNYFTDILITKIIFPSGHIDFNYTDNIKGTIGRKDLDGQNGFSFALDNIKVFADSSLISNFKTNLDYFNSGFGISGFENYRLKLAGIKNLLDNSEYSFEYNENNLPPINSLSKDLWGYYNGINNLSKAAYPNLYTIPQSSNGSDRSVNENAAQAFILKKIIYPTKGYSSFEYESNKIWEESLIPTIEQEAIANAYASFHENEFTVEEYSSEFYLDYNINNPSDSISYYIDFGNNCLNNTPIGTPQSIQPSNAYGYIQELQSNGSWLTLQQYYRDETNYEFPRYVKKLINGVIQTVPFHDPTKKKRLKVLLQRNDPMQYCSSSINITKQKIYKKQVSQNAIVGGLRIKSITDFDGINIYKKRSFDYTNPNDPNHRSSAKFTSPLKFVRELENRLHNPINIDPNDNPTGPGIILPPLPCYGLEVSDNQAESTSIFGNDVVNYQYVTEKLLGRGKIIYEFQENGRDLDIYDPYSIWDPYVLVNKNPLKIKKYSEDNKLIEEDSLIYRSNIIKNQLSPDALLNSEKISSSSSFEFLKFCVNQDCTILDFYVKLIQNYYVKSQKLLLDKQIKTLYFSSGNSLIETIYNYYETDINKPINLKFEKTTFPDGTINESNYKYAHEKGNQLMISKNMVGIPLETTTTQTTGGVAKTISKTETIYPVSVPTTQTGSLILPTSVLSYDLQNPTVSSTEVTYDKYDVKGNLQQYTTKDGISTTIIWGYNQTQPIAKIEGAKLSDIQQSMIDSIVNASNSDASNPANEPTLITALDSFRNNSGLAGYQISTYTYDPLIGVTSITPPSGIREVYLYDTANRLKEIREGNQTGKLLKEFKYNYKN